MDVTEDQSRYLASLIVGLVTCLAMTTLFNDVHSIISGFIQRMGNIRGNESSVRLARRHLPILEKFASLKRRKKGLSHHRLDPEQVRSAQSAINSQDFYKIPSLRVKCISCTAVLYAPDEQVFQCPCGETLIHPMLSDSFPSTGQTVSTCPSCLYLVEFMADCCVVCGQRVVEGHPLLTFNHDEDDGAEEKCSICQRDIDNCISEFLDGVYITIETFPQLMEQHDDQQDTSWRRRRVGEYQLGWETVPDLLSVTELIEIFELSADARRNSPHPYKSRLGNLPIEFHSDETWHQALSRLAHIPRDMSNEYSIRDLQRIAHTCQLNPNIVIEANSPLQLAYCLFVNEWARNPPVGTNSAQLSEGFVRRFRIDRMTEKTYLDCVAATNAVIPLRVQGYSNRCIFSTNEIIRASKLPFTHKVSWFRTELVKKLRVPWDSGHVRIRVRREHVLSDSLNSFLKLSPYDMRRAFRFEFIGEPGQDAGGVSREWFEEITKSLFDPNLGLFELNQSCYRICPQLDESTLQQFRFAGRVIGKAMFDGHHMGAHLARIYYKHILAWPIVEEDLATLDSEVSRSTREIRECSNVSALNLDFTMYSSQGVIELKPNGASVEVTNSTRDEYLALRLQQLALHQCAPQLHELLVGIYETVPLALLSAFDYSELELLICGMSDINVADWKSHTAYRGEYLQEGERHKVITWFWEILEEATREERTKFLQFSTGTTRAPVQGFAYLPGSDGSIKLFCIDSLDVGESVFPRAHTCFNRIDLPVYHTKEEMKSRIHQALSLECTGFELE